MNKFLFVLCPPYSGSTVLWKILQTSPHISALPKEGQFLEPVKHIMRDNPYNIQKKMPWDLIQSAWETYWDIDKSILLEKSPPNLIRALEIEQHFQESYFVAMIRNPYASCEGIYRRNHKFLEESVKFWIKCAEHQVNNIKNIRNITYFTYEDLTDSPEKIRKQLLEFMPDLETLDINVAMRVHSILGRQARKIENLNRHKINNLTDKDLSTINDILKDHKELMSFFGYQYIYPSVIRTVTRNIESPFAQLRAKGIRIRKRML